MHTQAWLDTCIAFASGRAPFETTQKNYMSRNFSEAAELYLTGLAGQIRDAHCKDGVNGGDVEVDEEHVEAAFHYLFPSPDGWDQYRERVRVSIYYLCCPTHIPLFTADCYCGGFFFPYIANLMCAWWLGVGRSGLKIFVNKLLKLSHKKKKRAHAALGPEGGDGDRPEKRLRPASET